MVEWLLNVGISPTPTGKEQSSLLKVFECLEIPTQCAFDDVLLCSQGRCSRTVMLEAEARQ